MNRKTAKRFLLLHIAAVAAALLFPLYARCADFLSFGLPKCLLHDVFYVYCPLCGGTRAVEALLRLNLTDALRCNALVVAALPFALVFYLRAWRRLLRGIRRTRAARGSSAYSYEKEITRAGNGEIKRPRYLRGFFAFVRRRHFRFCRTRRPRRGWCQIPRNSRTFPPNSFSFSASESFVCAASFS